MPTKKKTAKKKATKKTTKKKTSEFEALVKAMFGDVTFDPKTRYFDGEHCAKYRATPTFKALRKASGERQLSVYRGAWACRAEELRGRIREADTHRHGIAEFVVLPALVKIAPLTVADDDVLLDRVHPKGTKVTDFTSGYGLPLAAAFKVMLARPEPLAKATITRLRAIKARVDAGTFMMADGTVGTSIRLGCRLRAEGVDGVRILPEGKTNYGHQQAWLTALNEDFADERLEPVAQLIATVTGPKPTKHHLATVDATLERVPSAVLDECLQRWLPSVGDKLAEAPMTYKGFEEVRFPMIAIVWLAARSHSPAVRAELGALQARLRELEGTTKGIAPAAKGLETAATI